MKRPIIRIDEKKCTGCALCIPNCPEGAIQIIDGKARLVSELQCDGLGACLGHCPEGAIAIEERESAEYSEVKTMEYIVNAGTETVAAHLKHLLEHNQTEYYRQAVEYLKKNNIPVPAHQKQSSPGHSGCPGAKAFSFTASKQAEVQETSITSELTHWPVQLHLVSPSSPHFRNSDLLLAADCTSFTYGNFHKEFLKGKTLAIACPKLDDYLERYEEKLIALIDENTINTLTVLIMEVPCCSGLLKIAQSALSKAKRKIPLKCVVIGIKGDIVQNEWL